MGLSSLALLGRGCKLWNLPKEAVVSLQPLVASLEASSHSKEAVVQIALRPFPTDAVTAPAPLLLAVEKT